MIIRKPTIATDQNELYLKKYSRIKIVQTKISALKIGNVHTKEVMSELNLS